MTESAFACAALRALPLGLVLPLPTAWARVAIAIVLAIVGASIVGDVEQVSLARELARGVALGVGVALPIYAARASGAALGYVAVGRDPGLARLATTIAWVVFLLAGGGTLLVGAYLRSYATWPVATATAINVAALVRTGGEWLALVAQLALPILAIVALVEVAAALVSRFEHTTRFEPSATTIVRAARPILIVVLFAGAVAAFTHGVGAAVIAATR